jgi:hypothetical protein
VDPFTANSLALLSKDPPKLGWMYNVEKHLPHAPALVRLSRITFFPHHRSSNRSGFPLGNNFALLGLRIKPVSDVSNDGMRLENGGQAIAYLPFISAIRKAGIPKRAPNFMSSW